jgi:hypothetical protein
MRPRPQVVKDSRRRQVTRDAGLTPLPPRGSQISRRLGPAVPTVTRGQGRAYLIPSCYHDRSGILLLTRALDETKKCSSRIEYELNLGRSVLVLLVLYRLILVLGKSVE